MSKNISIKQQNSHKHHEHEHKHHEHEHEHEHCDIGGCGCGGGEGGHSHDEPATKTDIILWIISVLLFGVAFFIPESLAILRVAVFASSALIAGYNLFINGAKELFKLRLEENFLLLVAVVASFVLGEYPEACLVTILFKLGGFLESYAVSRSKKSMEALTKIRPDLATIKTASGEYQSIKAEEVAIGDTIYIRAGDKVALDCEITEGTSSIDSSALTGESLPVVATAGDTLLSGSINLTGLITAKVTKSFANSTASQIIEMVYASSQKKGKAENLISRFARIYTPIVIALAVIIAVVPPLVGLGEFHDYIMRALIFLVAACPCSLVISIPLSFFSSIGAASKMGVLVKGSMYMEKLSKVDAVCLDKTGTITSGRLEVDEVISLDNSFVADKILLIAASLEENSTHPIAKSIVSEAKRLNLPAMLAVQDLSEEAGLGIMATIENTLYRCGGPNMLIRLNYKNAELNALPKANVYICKGSNVIGAITLKEDISKDSLSLVEQLKSEGVRRIVMLTGDNEKSAKAVSEKCGISEYYAALLPADKVSKVESVKESSKAVLFVGDGINDAPVLAAADVSISMGLGSEIANASSDIVLASNRLSSLPKAINLAKRCMGIVYFNLGFAFAVKAIVLSLGATGNGTMWLAVFADIGVTILSVLNAVRILKVKK